MNNLRRALETYEKPKHCAKCAEVLGKEESQYCAECLAQIVLDNRKSK